MNIDDIIYLSMLIISIGFGKFYRKIDNLDTRKNVGTIAGLLIILIVSGFHTLHVLFTFIVNALIIKNVDPRMCHKVSFAFTFLYLFFFRTTAYFGIPYPPAHTNLVQMILTLKIVGLAFEVNRSQVKSNSDSDVTKTDKESEIINPSVTDIFHYCFNYMGVLTGPYYKYKTYIDSFDTPFSSYADNWSFTLQKLQFVPMFIVLFLWSSATWPLSYAVTDEFYHDRSWLYRYWYIWPNFFTFRMRIYIGLLLSECVCTMGGLGVYPTVCKPKPGQGPTENYSQLEEISRNSEQLAKQEYSYDTIKNINPYGADFCITYREAMKHWNICIQYWLAVNIHKQIPSKKLRTYLTMLVSAVWHGVYTGYYVCIATVPFVLIVEDVWVKLFLNEEAEKRADFKLKASKFALWFFRMHFFSYQAIAMHLLEVGKIWHYYNSVYHMGLIVGIVLYVLGSYIYKKQRRRERPQDDNKEIATSSEIKNTKLHTS